MPSRVLSSIAPSRPIRTVSIVRPAFRAVSIARFMSLRLNVFVPRICTQSPKFGAIYHR
jgi:hypothetical protein